MAQFQRHFVQELTKPLIVRQCGDLGFSGDNLSDVISVELYTDGVAYSGGGTCSGACICPDGSTVALSGSVSGKTASVTLTEDCFAIPGQIGIAIRVTSGTTKTTVLKAIYSVEPFSTNNPVDPGSRITLDVGDLINRIDAAVESIPASADQLKAAMAPTFSDATAYRAGAYVWYNGTLYKFTTAHAAGSWTGTDAVTVALGNDAINFKKSLDDTDTYLGIDIGTWIDGKAYNTPGSVMNATTDSYTTVNTFSCTWLSVNPGDKVKVVGKGGSGSKLWVWTKANGDIKDATWKAASNATLTESDDPLTAPEDAAYLLVSVETAIPHKVIKGDTVNDRIVNASELSNIRNLAQYHTFSVDNGKVDILSALRPITGKTMSTSTVFPNTTVLNFEQYATDLATSILYEPIRIRDNDGNLIAPIHIEFNFGTSTSANVAYGYTADGSPDRVYKPINDASNGILNIDSTTYYLVFQKFTVLVLYLYTEVSAFRTDYYVGDGQEYTTFHDCLVALKENTTSKTIHVYGGTYDILDEMGGTTFLNSLTGSENWYDVCDIIPPNTHVIGHGNVIFDLTIPSGTASEKAVLLSPINMIGSSTVENVTINCDGGRYCVHAEGSNIAANNNAVWRIINCKINKTNSISGADNAIGAGINNGGYLEVRDCVITNTGNAGILVHDQQTAAGSFPYSPRIVVTNCAIDVAYYPIVMSSTHSGATTGAVLEMTVINCYCNNKFMRKIGSGNSDVFHATYINTPHRTQNQDGINNIIPDTEYNNFALQ